jgi:hypothetical protein
VLDAALFFVNLYYSFQHARYIVFVDSLYIYFV